MRHFSFLLAFLFATLLSVSAQSEMVIEPGAPGVLNTTILGDTTATGERNDSNRVYVLRGAVPYLITATLEFSGFHLHIKAEDTASKKPLLIVDSGAGALSQIFRTQGSGDLTLDGLHISGKDILGAYNSRIIRINSDDSRITVNDCLIEEAGQSGIRVQGDNPKIYITNSIWRNMGRPSNPDNGRMIDNRGVPIDTLWIDNCVVYNVTSRIYRNGSGSSIKWAKINQSTFWGSGQHGFSLDKVTALEFTNNLVFNAIFLGRSDSLQIHQNLPEYWVEIDTFIQDSTPISIHHNNFHTDQEIIDLYPLVDSSEDGEMLISVENYKLDPEAQAAVDSAGDGSTNIDEDLAFPNDPPTPTQFIMRNAADTTAGSEIPTADPWDFSDLDKDTVWSAIGTGTIDRWSAIHDFTVPDTAVSFTAGTDGQPLGAIFDGPVPITDIIVENNILFYPNPVSSKLYIQHLNGVKLKNIRVISLSGQVLKIVEDIQSDILQLELRELPAGIYLISLTDIDGNTSSRKILKQ